MITDEIKQIKNQIKNLAIQNQGYVGDWYIINEPISYVTTKTVKFDEILASNYFSVGDKVRWKEGSGPYKYGYVESISGTNIVINGGTDYPLASATYTELAKGVSATPSGHPILLRYNPNILGIFGTYSNINPAINEKAYFGMMGRLVQLKIDVGFGSISGATTPLQITPPIPADVGKEYVRIPITVNQAFGWNIGLMKIGGSTIIEVYADHNTLGGFLVTSGGMGFHINTTYFS